MPRKPPVAGPYILRLAACLVGVLALAAAELGLRCVVPATRLDNILALLRPDSELLWTQKPRLRADFFGTAVATDDLGLRLAAAPRGSGRVRVLALGASPTFGWGVPADATYAALLRELLAAEVVNGGIIGYSTHQGLGFLKRYWDRLRPDIVTIAYVINDVDSYRFFRSGGGPDKALRPAPGALTAARGAVSRLALYRLLRRLLRRGAKTACPGEVRVSLEDYRANLKRLVELVRERGAEPVFVKMPVNLPRGKDPADPEFARGSLRAGRTLMDKGDCRAAAEAFRQALEADPHLGRAHYYLGECARRLGRSKDAAEHFRRVKEAESRRCARDAVRYNAAMEELGRELGVPLADAAAAFGRHPDEYLFVDRNSDTIHPNAAGHRVIADELARLLRNQK
ncbi:MAG: GDSL-type esterase/lipase family protein [Elusimicrobiota bacterium]